MDEVTQQNSALVEENASAAKSLEEQSAAMDERVSFFRVGAEAKNVAVMPKKRRVDKVGTMTDKALRYQRAVAGVQGRARGQDRRSDWEEF